MMCDIEELLDHIEDYLYMGGLFNPELANHEAVRNLLIDIRDTLNGNTTLPNVRVTC
jgi:hypothetical protein